ncbi:hypothetical protein CHISP_3561 [Chitinispirillum alkaliphilum]|nr:hypothetical protein CHISP_3561 [Chitinispirillum alkaliphilum]
MELLYRFTIGVEYTFVRRSDYGFGDCPLEARAVEDVRVFLQSVSSYRLTDIHREVLSPLSSAEYNAHGQEFFLSSYDDCSGRIAFILHHIKQNSIAAALDISTIKSCGNGSNSSVEAPVTLAVKPLAKWTTCPPRP